MINISDIEQAALRLKDVSISTPLIQNLHLDGISEGNILIKPECLQVTGSFKIRGAYNFLSQLTKVEAKKGIVTWSSGNHAQGIAAAGSFLNIKTLIVMPNDAPKIKIENTRRLGGEIIGYDRYSGDREAIANEISRIHDSIIVPSYDHKKIIAGQGTVGLELAKDSISMGLPPDQVLIPCGGGGLSSGSSLALKSLLKNVEIYAVEPSNFDDTARSYKSGMRQRVNDQASSICDSLQTPIPGELTFDINRELLSGVLTVTDEEVKEAIKFSFKHLKMVVEPGGAVALAAILFGKINTKNKITAIVLSGGNIDLGLFNDIQLS
ncbi:MAG: pyridoxal-5'-phosphate-dependent protein [Woeseia sp.]|nr:pyridoxal-5'-phosphate-dependent protein [Woeseia sp.]|tara:strand:+ start:311 stop:1279 length:969 start_codon:yes stop_codon:yes gene_type:complete